MRYYTAHKELTHQRIIDVASRLFKQQGIDATGVAAVMSKAKLTNGAFYAHFKSKETLVQEVIADQLDYKFKTFWDIPQDTTGLREIIDTYLSPEHRDDYAGGCPFAALQDEIARHRPEATLKIYNDGVMQAVKRLQENLPSNHEQPRATALALMSLLVGTLQLSRAMSDIEISNSVLESGRKAAYNLVG